MPKRRNKRTCWEIATEEQQRRRKVNAAASSTISAHELARKWESWIWIAAGVVLHSLTSSRPYPLSPILMQTAAEPELKGRHQSVAVNQRQDLDALVPDHQKWLAVGTVVRKLCRPALAGSQRKAVELDLKGLLSARTANALCDLARTDATLLQRELAQLERGVDVSPVLPAQRQTYRWAAAAEALAERAVQLAASLGKDEADIVEDLTYRPNLLTPRPKKADADEENEPNGPRL